MVVSFKSNDEKEINRLAKSLDMALCLWELRNNFWRKWKYSGKDIPLDELRDEFNKLLEEYSINVDDLVE